MNEKILKQLLSSINYQLNSIQTSVDLIQELIGGSDDISVKTTEKERKNNVLEITLEDFVSKIEESYEPEYLEND